MASLTKATPDSYSSWKTMIAFSFFSWLSFSGLPATKRSLKKSAGVRGCYRGMTVLWSPTSLFSPTLAMTHPQNISSQLTTSPTIGVVRTPSCIGGRPVTHRTPKNRQMHICHINVQRSESKSYESYWLVAAKIRTYQRERKIK